MDDVLHDFNTALHAYHNKKYGTKIKREDIISYDIESIWKCTPQEAVAKVFEFYQTQEHHDTKPLDGSVDVVKKLAESYELHIITSRVPEIESLTKDWINRHFPSIFKSVQLTNQFGSSSGPKRKKADVCKELSVDLMIEDSLEHARAISSSGIPVILIDSPWNQGKIPDNVRRVYSWNEIGSILL